MELLPCSLCCHAENGIENENCIDRRSLYCLQNKEKKKNINGNSNNKKINLYKKFKDTLRSELLFIKISQLRHRYVLHRVNDQLCINVHNTYALILLIYVLKDF